jgi:hypothetical protein
MSRVVRGRIESLEERRLEIRVRINLSQVRRLVCASELKLSLNRNHTRVTSMFIASGPLILVGVFEGKEFVELRRLEMQAFNGFFPIFQARQVRADKGVAQDVPDCGQ